jgi:hypothetical protein
MSPQQKKIEVKVQFSEIYGQEIVNGYIESGTIHKKENKAYIFTHLDPLGNKLRAQFRYFDKEKNMYFNHRYHAEHGLKIIERL